MASIFIGFVFALLIYNLLLALNGKSLPFAVNALVGGSSALVSTLVHNQWLNVYQHQAPWWQAQDLGLTVIPPLLLLSGAWLARTLLPTTEQLQHQHRRLSQLLVGTGLGSILVIVMTAWFPAAAQTSSLLLLGLGSCGLCIVLWQFYRAGHQAVLPQAVSWLILACGLLYFTISLAVADLPISKLSPDNVLLFASAVQFFMLTLMLTRRSQQIDQQKYDNLRQQHDVVVQLKSAEAQLVHRALHSRTTGLPNRTLLKEVIDQIIEQGKVPEFAFVLISLNNFHEFNKTLGHSNGDAILYLLTERLLKISEQIPQVLPIESSEEWSSTLAAVEGVNFALLIEHSDSESLNLLIRSVIEQLETPFEFDHLMLDVDAAAGIALFPKDSQNGEHLIRNAHVALEMAVNTNTKCAFYAPDIDPYNSRRLSLLAELRSAIDNEILELYFQPQISLRDQQVTSAEVLVRWLHPEYGFVSPEEFIPLAEKTGVIQPLTYHICRQAFGYKKALEKLGYFLHLSINISARNLLDPGFKNRICELAAELDINLREINLELTETAVMTDPDMALEMMAQLNSAGIQLSIDDFGTGYSCLSYLKKLPVDEIKIDRSFVMDMVNNEDDQMIVRTTLTMGHNLNLAVVAEGIENEDTLATLAKMGCDLAQGYHIARPMPFDAFADWLASYPLQLGADSASHNLSATGMSHSNGSKRP